MILKPSPAIVAVFGLTIFLGAFLLFQVQLLIGKYILPWYGGVPMVWTTCMLFFQVALLAGYAYAHLIVRRLPPTRQRVLHVAMLALTLAVVGFFLGRWDVPLLPDAAWKPTASDGPTWHIVQLLAVAIGAPFFVASTASPLLQSWFGTTYATTSPYRLYALSNLGSLLGLLTYPAIVEVWLPLQSQAWLWAGGFAVFAAGVVVCALATGSGSGRSARPSMVRIAGGSADLAEAPGVEPLPDSRSRRRPLRPRMAAAPPEVAAWSIAPPDIRAREWALWLALSACPSALLLATTNYMSQEIAVVPFLWIIPLSLYLVSWVLTFDRDFWYARGSWAALLALGVTLSAFALERGVWPHLLVQIGVAAFTLFAACMVCHGELARTRPHAAHLTAFYLAITVGGALGGAFVSLAAPVLFAGTWEYPLTLWLVAALALVAFVRDRRSPLHAAPLGTLLVTVAATAAVAAYIFRERLPWTVEIADAGLFGIPAVVAVAGFASAALVRRRRADASAGGRRGGAIIAAAVALGLVVVGIAFVHVARSGLSHTVEHARSFYGIVQVEAIDPGGDAHEVRLRHGRIVHGKQYLAPDLRREPTAYYGRDSGVALAIGYHPRREAGLRIGVIGLGAGTLAAYGEAGDALRFYELNPDVTRLAGPDGRAFTFVKESEARIEIVPGDARLALEAELARGERQRFDVLAVDAFSSDAIPAHLLTREAVAVYLAHLDAGGVLALHITNRYLDLKPVVRGLATHFGLAHAFVSAIDGQWTWRNDWALLTRDPARLAGSPIADVRDTEPSDAPAVLWTDDYSNLLRLLNW